MINRKSFINLLGAILGIGLLVALGFVLSGWFRAMRTTRESAPASRQPQPVVTEPTESIPDKKKPTVIRPEEPITQLSAIPREELHEHSIFVEPGEWQRHTDKEKTVSVWLPPNWSYNSILGAYEALTPKIAEMAPVTFTLVFGGIKEHRINNVLFDDEFEAQRHIASESSDPEKIQIIENLLVDGQEAIEVKGTPGFAQGIGVFIRKDGLFYVIDAHPWVPDHPTFGKYADDLELMFNEVVDSFRFLD